MSTPEITEVPDKVDTLDFLNEQLEKESLTEPEQKEEALVETPDKEIEEPGELALEETPEIKEDEISFDAFKRSDVVKKYPTIFKEFPDLEKKIYRGEKFEEIFPTLKEASDAKDRASTLEQAEGLLFSGDVTDILKSVKNEDEEAFKRIVDNFLPTIESLDKGVYLQLMGNTGRFFIKNMINEAQRFGQQSEQYKALTGSAMILNQFLFGNSQLQDLTPISKPVSEADNRISEREQQLIGQRFQEVQTSITERISNTLTATINKYIDPKDSMTPYVRAKAVDDVKSLLDKAIGTDERFKQNYDRLWQSLIAQDFNKSSQDVIVNTYFNKCKTQLFEIIKKVRNDALSSARSTSPVKKVEQEVDEPIRARANSAAPKRGQEDGKRKGESTSDYLNRMLG